MPIPKRKITKADIEGVGEVFIKEPSAALSIRIQGIKADTDAERYGLAMAEAMAACLVDENGKPVFASAAEALEELSSVNFNKISAEIVKGFSSVGEAEKNSETIPS